MENGEQLKIVEKLRVMTDSELIDYYKVTMAYSVQLGPDSPKWDMAHRILKYVREERIRRGLTESVYGGPTQQSVQTRAERSVAKKKKKKKTGLVIFLVILLLLIGAAAAAFASGMVTVDDVKACIEQVLPAKEQGEKAPVQPEADSDAEPVAKLSYEEEIAAYACLKIEEYLNRVLKNPTGMIVNAIEGVPYEEGLIIRFDYSAENSMGGYQRDEMYIIVSKQGTSYSITTLGDKEFTGSSNQSYTKKFFEEAAGLGVMKFDPDRVRQ